MRNEDLSFSSQWSLPADSSGTFRLAKCSSLFMSASIQYSGAHDMRMDVEKRFLSPKNVFKNNSPVWQLLADDARDSCATTIRWSNLCYFFTSASCWIVDCIASNWMIGRSPLGRSLVWADTVWVSPRRPSIPAAADASSAAAASRARDGASPRCWTHGYDAAL